MLHLPMPVRPLKLHRGWHEHLWDAAVQALHSAATATAAALREHRRRRVEREEWQAAVELDARILRDVGAPTWLQSQAESVREQRRFERDLLAHGVRRELRHFR